MMQVAIQNTLVTNILFSTRWLNDVLIRYRNPDN